MDTVAEQVKENPLFKWDANKVDDLLYYLTGKTGWVHSQMCNWKDEFIQSKIPAPTPQVQERDDWEIRAFKSSLGNVCYLRSNGKYSYDVQHSDGIWTLEVMQQDLTNQIFSVLRKNDNEVFTVGDICYFKIDGKKDTVFKISKFKVWVDDNTYPTHTLQYKRISDPVIFGITGTRPAMDHGYSKMQPENANGSFLKLGRRRLLNGITHAYIKNMGTPSGETCWSNLDPALLYVFSLGKIVAFNPNLPSAQASTTFFDLAPFGYKSTVTLSLGENEGNISFGDKYVVVTTEKTANTTKWHVCINLQTKQSLPFDFVDYLFFLVNLLTVKNKNLLFQPDLYEILLFFRKNMFLVLL